MAFGLILFDDDGFRRGGLINEIILPFIRIAVIVNWRVDRFVTAEAPIHIDDILVRDLKTLCDQGHLIGTKVAAFECSDFAFRRAQLEKKPLLVCGRADFHK